ncbi:MAG: histidine phosphatase family protein [Deltaproteobacteria bacterium]|nr:histidine phosphatase family protein [Deltaproteobacteria bacterium]
MATKHLTLIRHAKASVNHRGGRGDFDRPLAERGERDAKRMATRLAAIGFAPDLLVSSAAERALQTAHEIAGRIDDLAESIVTRDDMYLASARALLDIVRETEAGVRHLVLVGHNPGLSDLWDWLVDERGGGLPTGGIARLELSVGSWLDASQGDAILLDFDHPRRELKPDRRRARQ